MGREKQEIPERFMDVRLRDKYLGEGKITKAQVDEYLKSLPDDSDSVDTSELYEGHESSSSGRNSPTGPQKS